MIECEFCKKEHNGSYGSGRFCSHSCAMKYVSIKYANTPEKKKQKSEKLKGRPIPWITNEIRKKAGETHRLRYAQIKEKHNKKLLLIDWNLLENNKQRKFRVFDEQNKACNICKIKKWKGNKITFEMHHKDGNQQNFSRDNLEVLCPNCHSQTSNYRWSIFVPKYSKDKVSKNLRK